ncbi:hypothetical protein [Streptomyces sp. HUAS TT7]|uniref:hypothetical protein n=1 Tax=Streptomyces sp. HUAS TT7 TaxID=3447507 RepID=UPI003F659524
MSHSSALQLADTRRALRHYRAGVWRCVEGGTGSVVFAVVLAAAVRHPPGVLVSILVALGVAVFAIGIGALSVAGRMRRALASAPWTAYRAVVVPRSRQTIAVILRRSWARGTASAGRGRDPYAPRCRRTRARRRAVVLRCPWLARGVDAARQWGTGVDDAHTHRPPAGQAGRGRHGRGRTDGAGPCSGSDGGPWGTPGPAGVTDRSVPGVVAAGAALFAFGAYAQTSSRGAPLVDLTVLSERPDGSCTVSWTDPLDFGLRTGPFH